MSRLRRSSFSPSPQILPGTPAQNRGNVNPGAPQPRLRRSNSLANVPSDVAVTVRGLVNKATLPVQGQIARRRSRASTVARKRRSGIISFDEQSMVGIAKILQKELPDNVEEWNVNEVKKWLGSIQAGRYIYNFGSNLVDGETLINADDALLIKLKINSPAARRNILTHLDELRKDYKNRMHYDYALNNWIGTPDTDVTFLVQAHLKLEKSFKL